MISSACRKRRLSASPSVVSMRKFMAYQAH
jgi:hypothetical protein